MKRQKRKYYAEIVGRGQCSYDEYHDEEYVEREYLAENGINIDGELYCVECYDEDEQNEEEEGADL